MSPMCGLCWRCDEARRRSGADPDFSFRAAFLKEWTLCEALVSRFSIAL